MHKDSNGNFIGRGEDSAFELLLQIYPDKEIKRQVKFKDLLSGEWIDTVTERQEKETIDLVVYSDPIIAIRVQDPHHNGRLTSARDLVQRKTLEWNGVRVVDLQHYECVELMKENVSDKSMKELLNALKEEGIH
jgi:hypothetical protein|tara:strand:+ start:5193 stop:5594 length:402 start_codon:yes stop_codon:yes gene_type:complete